MNYCLKRYGLLSRNGTLGEQDIGVVHILVNGCSKLATNQSSYCLNLSCEASKVIRKQRLPATVVQLLKMAKYLMVVYEKDIPWGRTVLHRRPSRRNRARINPFRLFRWNCKYRKL